MSHFISNTKLLWTWLWPSWLASSLERHTPNAPPTRYTKSSNHLFSTFHRLALNFNQVISSIQLPAPNCLPTAYSSFSTPPGILFSWKVFLTPMLFLTLLYNGHHNTYHANPSPLSLFPGANQQKVMSTFKVSPQKHRNSIPGTASGS